MDNIAGLSLSQRENRSTFLFYFRFRKNVQLFPSGNFIITIYDLKEMQFSRTVRMQHSNFEFGKFNSFNKNSHGSSEETYHVLICIHVSELFI